MDILSHSKQTAEENGIDIACYVINYIDHELITFDLIKRFAKDSIDTKLTISGSIVLTFNTNTTEEYRSLKDGLSELIESNPIVDISGKLY